MMPEGGCCLFSDVGLLVVEGRLSTSPGSQRRPQEGPHCPPLLASASPPHHICNDSNFLCDRASKLRKHMGLLIENWASMSIEVLLCPDCPCGAARSSSTNICQAPSPSDLLVEQWTVSLVKNPGGGGPNCDKREGLLVDERALLQAVRSSLHFSQLASWCALGAVRHLTYRLCHPPVGSSLFTRTPAQHNFPLAPVSPSTSLKVSVKSLPRLESMPSVICPLHHESPLSTLKTTVSAFKSVFAELGHSLLDPPARIPPVKHGFTVWRDSKPETSSSSHRLHGVVDDRMQSGCQHIGKHRCEEDKEGDVPLPNRGSAPRCQRKCVSPDLSDCELIDDRGEKSNMMRSEKKRIVGRADCSTPRPKPPGRTNPLKRKWATERNCGTGQFAGNGTKKLLSDDASGLARLFNRMDISRHQPLSVVSIDLPVKEPKFVSPEPKPAPSETPKSLAIPRSQSWQVTDSSSEETEGESPARVSSSRPPPSPRFRPRTKCRPLLGNFEESVLNGRLAPSSVVEGFTADLGASSGSFCPPHLKLPITMSYFSVEPHSSPSLGQMRISKKGYTVPPSGTIQLSVLNPLGTVMKMFVVNYDVSDMPPNSHTFIRQRAVSIGSPPSSYFVLHLRLRSSKSGRISIWDEIKALICRRQGGSDPATACDGEGILDTTTIMPSSPRYSNLRTSIVTAYSTSKNKP